MITKELKLLINKTLKYIYEYDGAEIKDKELINNMKNLVKYMETNSISRMNEIDLNTNRLSCNFIMNLIKNEKIRFEDNNDRLDFLKEVNLFDDLIEKQEIAYSIKETCFRTKDIHNG